MLKVKIQGEPSEIGAFFARLEQCEGIRIEYKSDVSKRDAGHKWGSAIAGLHVEAVVAPPPTVTIYEGRRGKFGAVGKMGYVYVLPYFGADGIEGYKIGKTTNPRSRRKTFSVKLNFSIIFMALIYSDDYSALEKQLHQQYATKRRGASEWFDLDINDLIAIQALMSDADKKLLDEINK